uniref:HD2 n=1 Tax=Volvariella volvacea TaxID=36659 RepID=W0C3T6_9AGAR|nr:HD2 [Volvariella volvacea]AOC97533.1 HD2 protein [Volvariella volvacea]
MLPPSTALRKPIPPQTLTARPALDLHLPKHIQADIDCLPPDARQVISRQIDALNSLYHSSYAKSCAGVEANPLPQLPDARTFQRLRSCFENMYRQKEMPRVEAWIESARAKRRRVSKDENSTQRPRFKHEYSQLLENYFSKNAYPSRPDRAVLARKSGMTLKQIEVWFQNHRSRAKKEGRALSRPKNPESPSIVRPSASYEGDRVTGISAATTTIVEVCSVSGVWLYTHASLQRCNLLSDSDPSPGTFPCRYSLQQPGIKPTLVPIVWPRSASICTYNNRTDVDIDSLCTNFALKLQFRDRREKSSRSSTPVRQSHLSSFYTYAVPAPLPALRQEIQTVDEALRPLRPKEATFGSRGGILTRSPIRSISRHAPFAPYIIANTQPSFRSHTQRILRVLPPPKPSMVNDIYHSAPVAPLSLDSIEYWPPLAPSCSSQLTQIPSSTQPLSFGIVV